MKILYINTVYGNGSTGKIVRQLGEAVEQAGGEFRVAYGRGERQRDRHVYYIGTNLGTSLHCGFSRMTDRAGFYSKNATKGLIKYIRGYQPDLIHLHNLHGYYLNLPILFDYLAKEYKGKIIWTFHDCWPYTGHCTYYSYAQCDRWKTQCSHCTQIHEYPKSIAIDNSLRNFLEKRAMIKSVEKKLTIVTVSNWLLNEVTESGINASQLMTIHNGIDTERFNIKDNTIRTQYGIGNKYMILCVSDGWNQRKGYEQILELSKLIDKNSVIVVIGLTKKQIKNLPSGVIGLERTWDQEELIKFYNAADVLFNPSKEETFGLVTAEAMACGTPAVVYNVTACPEIVGGDNCGYIIKDSPYAKNVVAKNLKHLFVTKRSVTNACRQRTVNMFTEKGMQQKYLKLYRELLYEQNGGITQ